MKVMSPALVKPPLKNWGVAGQLSDTQILQLLTLEQLNPFVQSRSKDGSYTFIEFWISNQDLILEEVLKVIPDILL